MENSYKVTLIDKSILNKEKKNKENNVFQTAEIVSYPLSLEKQQMTMETTSSMKTITNVHVDDVPVSNFKKSIIYPKCTIVNTALNSSILDESLIANENGLLLIDIDEKNKEKIDVNCTSSMWQTESSRIDCWKFHDLDNTTTTIKNIVIEGSLDHVLGIYDIIKPTKDIDQIEHLIGIFKEYNESLRKKMNNNNNNT